MLIPETYVRDLPVRLGLYRRIGALASDAETEAMAAELVDRFGPLPRGGREPAAGGGAEARLPRGRGGEAGGRAEGHGAAVPRQRVPQPGRAGVAGSASKGGLVRLRPDHKLAIVREMDVATRLRLARDTLASLAGIVDQAKAA